MVNDFIHMEKKKTKGWTLTFLCSSFSHCESVNLNVGSLSWRMCDVKLPWGAIKQPWTLDQDMGLILEHQLWAPAALLQTSCLCPSSHPPKNTLLLSLRKIPETQTHTSTRAHTHWAQLALSVETSPNWSSVLWQMTQLKLRKWAFH